MEPRSGLKNDNRRADFVAQVYDLLANDEQIGTSVTGQRVLASLRIPLFEHVKSGKDNEEGTSGKTLVNKYINRSKACPRCGGNNIRLRIKSKKKKAKSQKKAESKKQKSPRKKIAKQKPKSDGCHANILIRTCLLCGFCDRQSCLSVSSDSQQSNVPTPLKSEASSSMNTPKPSSNPKSPAPTSKPKISAKSSMNTFNKQLKKELNNLANIRKDKKRKGSVNSQSNSANGQNSGGSTPKNFSSTLTGHGSSSRKGSQKSSPYPSSNIGSPFTSSKTIQKMLEKNAISKRKSSDLKKSGLMDFLESVLP